MLFSFGKIVHFCRVKSAEVKLAALSFGSTDGTQIGCAYRKVAFRQSCKIVLLLRRFITFALSAKFHCISLASQLGMHRLSYGALKRDLIGPRYTNA